MKKQLILAAAAALVITTCRGQDIAPFSVTTTLENQSTTSVSPSSSGHGGGDASSETATDEGLATQLDWSQEARYLDEALGVLNQNQMRYMGTWSISLERADLPLEDGTRPIFLNTTNDAGNPKGAGLMIVNEQFNDNGLQKSYLNQYDVNDLEEYYPETVTRLLRQEELWRYNQTDLSITRNEILARHGRKYEDPLLNTAFSRKSWYQPTYSGEEFNAVQDSVLSGNERKNLALLIQMEEEREFQKKDGGGYEQPVPIANGSWIDLDLDGQKERTTYQMETNNPYSSEVYELSVGESQMKGPGESLHQYPYITSLDGATTQLIVRQGGPSGDPMADVCVYRGGSSRKADNATGGSIQIYKDFTASRGQHDFFQTYRGMQEHQLSNDAVTMVQEDFYEQNKEAVSLAVIPFYVGKEIPDISVTLNPRDEVMILGSDYREWVPTQRKEAGERGRLKCGDEDSPYLCAPPDGGRDEPWNLFDGLSFYG